LSAHQRPRRRGLRFLSIKARSFAEGIECKPHRFAEILHFVQDDAKANRPLKPTNPIMETTSSSAAREATSAVPRRLGARAFFLPLARELAA
jgi:hypothetical protein